MTSHTEKDVAEIVERCAHVADFAAEHCNDGVGADVARKIAVRIRALSSRGVKADG